MKQPYIPPRMGITIFAPTEKLSASDFYDSLEPLNPNADPLDILKLTDLTGSAGQPTISNPGDIFLPF